MVGKTGSGTGTCGACGKSFKQRRPSDPGQFCSNTCAGLAKRSLPEPERKRCIICDTEFQPTRKYPLQRFCSRACGLSTVRTPEHQSRAGKIGGQKAAKSKRGKGSGYVKRGQRHEHRVVAEANLGRPLLSGEIVHHRDETKSNNEPTNLEVIGSQSEHARLHFKGKKHSAEHVARRVAARKLTMLARARAAGAPV